MDSYKEAATGVLTAALAISSAWSFIKHYKPKPLRLRPFDQQLQYMRIEAR